MGGGGGTFFFLNIRHTYPTMVKLDTVIPYLRKRKKMHKSRDTFFSSADMSIFFFFFGLGSSSIIWDLH